jgi:hypothetical protein
MSFFRGIFLALVLATFAAAQQSVSFPPKMVDASAPISMAKAHVPFCSLTEADAARRAGASKLGLW